MSRALLDTSVAIESLRNNLTITTYLDTFEDLCFTSIGLGELYYGAYKSTQRERHLAECSMVEATLTIYDIDHEVSKLFGQVKYDLRRTGKMIPENDIWIAAVALRYRITLITLDTHFERVEGLEVVLLRK